MTLLLPRRSFLLGLGAILAAPAIVKASSLMPVRSPKWAAASNDGLQFLHEWFADGKLIATTEGPTLIVPQCGLALGAKIQVKTTCKNAWTPTAKSMTLEIKGASPLWRVV